jgi:serine phosphatase RsbU (regulator of sigma subunit)
MTTDGFIDQANHQRERFGSRRLRELIDKVHCLPMNEQSAQFELALDQHQGNTEQRDDINLIGIRV